MIRVFYEKTVKGDVERLIWYSDTNDFVTALYDFDENMITRANSIYHIKVVAMELCRFDSVLKKRYANSKLSDEQMRLF